VPEKFDEWTLFESVFTDNQVSLVYRYTDGTAWVVAEQIDSWGDECYATLFLDGDMLIRADCPEPPPVGDALGLVNPSQRHKFAGHALKMDRMAKAWCKRLGVDPRTAPRGSHGRTKLKQAQGGFRLVPREFSGFYRTCWNAIKALSSGPRNTAFIKHDNADMGFEAAMRVREAVPIEWLPDEWDINLPPYDKPDAWRDEQIRASMMAGRPVLPGYITHFGGGRFTKKVERMREYDWQRVPTAYDCGAHAES